MTDTRRAARDSTRQAMLAAAVQLLQETPGGDLFAKVKPADVAARAGRTTGAFYNIWPNHAAFHHDVLEYAVDSGVFDVPAQLVDALTGWGGGSLAELAQTIAAAHTDEARRPVFDLRMALAVRSTEDPAAAELVRRIYCTNDAVLVPLYDRCVTRTGRRWLPPFDAAAFAVLVAGVIDGMLLWPTADVDECAVAVEQLLAGVTDVSMLRE